MYESFGQEFVLQDRVLVDPPVHAVPPLAACCTIVLDPLSVPPPHVLEHDPQLHELHSQLTAIIIVFLLIEIEIISYLIYLGKNLFCRTE